MTDRDAGGETVATDHATIDAAPVKRLAATLDRDDRSSAPGDALPTAWHWLHFVAAPRQAALSADGRGSSADLLPSFDGMSRMWAGGSFEIVRPLRIGEQASRRSRILTVADKTGRGGRFTVATVEHRVSGENGEAFREEQRLLFRPHGPIAVAGGERAGVSEAPWRRHIVPDEVLLFRFSALTFNAHRIHYDADFARAVEGYPGLVVHGPLTAMLLLDLVDRNAPGQRLARFDCRAVRPLFAGRGMALLGAPAADRGSVTLWAEDDHGYVAMRAEVGFA